MSIKLTDAKNWKADLAGTDSLLDKLSLCVTGLNIAANWNSPVDKIPRKIWDRDRWHSPVAPRFLLPGPSSR